MQNPMSKQIRAAIAFFVLCMLQAVSIPAFATSVTPLQVELTSVGKGSRSQVTITNTGATPLPLEIQPPGDEPRREWRA